jgi:hypothetical protein
MNKPHGGARKGSGRKKTEKPAKEALTMRIDPLAAEKFKALCAASNRSQTAQFEAILSREDRLAEKNAKNELLLDDAELLIRDLIVYNTSGMLRNRAQRFFNQYNEIK